MTIRSKRYTAAVLVGLVVLLAVPQPALAYLDPGTGSMLLQVLLGTALGMAAAIAVFWRQVISFLSRIFHRSNGDDSEQQEPPEE